MIDMLHSYSQHTLIGVVSEGIPAFAQSIKSLVNDVALSTIAQIAISCPLFFLQHNSFILGFTVGFIFDKQIREVVEKVNIVFNAKRTFLENVLFFGGTGFLAILTMPTSLIISTLYYSSQWGAKLYQVNAKMNKKAEDADETNVQVHTEINIQAQSQEVTPQEG